jgi:hypothetical protein
MYFSVIVGATRRALVPVLFCSCILFSGCATHYYRVSDPVTGRTYYTDDLKKIEGDGIELKDARTGETVIIQNSEVREINQYEFDSGRMQSGKTTR